MSAAKGVAMIIQSMKETWMPLLSSAPTAMALGGVPTGVAMPPTFAARGMESATPERALAFLIEPLVKVTDLLWESLLLLLEKILINLQISVTISYNYNASIFWIYIIFLWSLGRNLYYENRHHKSYRL